MSPERLSLLAHKPYKHLGVLAHALGTLEKYRSFGESKMLTTHNLEIQFFMPSSKFLKFCLVFEAA